MSSPLVYLISGANRGLGFALTETLAKRSGTIVFAGARDPAKATALNELASKLPNLHVVKLTSGSAEDNKAAVDEIEKVAGKLDVVIANAGISKYYGPLATTPISEFEDHFNINTIGVVVLFQAVHTLLLKSPTGAPQFTLISTGIASIELMPPFMAAAYGSSKVSSNWLVKLIHVEHAKEGIVAMSINPGWVATDMGNTSAKASGMPQAPVSVADSVAGILSHVDGATRAEKSGKFWNFKITSGNPWDVPTEVVPW